MLNVDTGGLITLLHSRMVVILYLHAYVYGSASKLVTWGSICCMSQRQWEGNMKADSAVLNVGTGGLRNLFHSPILVILELCTYSFGSASNLATWGSICCLIQRLRLTNVCINYVCFKCWLRRY